LSRDVTLLLQHQLQEEVQMNRERHNGDWFGIVLKPLFFIYFAGLFISVPYFNWCYARDHGFASWLLLGEIVATAESTVWPYYALSGSSKPDWSDSERENLEHYHRSSDAIRQAVRIMNAGPRNGPSQLTPEESDAWIALKKIALNEARKVDLEVLAKAHPNLPSQFREKYLRSLELANPFQERDVPLSEQMAAQTLFDEWVDWFNANRANIHLPKRQ